MFSASNKPDEGHSWRARAMSVSASLPFPALRSNRTASNQSNGLFGFFSRASSSNDLAFVTPVPALVDPVGSNV